MKKLKLDREILKRDVQKLKDDLVRIERSNTDEGREIDIYISTAAVVGAAVLAAGVTAAVIISKKRKRRKCCCCECGQEPIKVEPVKIDSEEESE